MAELVGSLFATSAVELALEKLLSFASNTVFASNFAENEVGSLKIILPEIQDQLAKLEDHQLDRSSTVKLKNWFVRLRAAAYDADDLLGCWTTKYQQWKQEVGIFPFHLLHPHFQYRKSCKVKEIIARLDQISEEGKCFENQTNGSSKAIETGALLELPSKSVVSREDDKREIIRQLITDEESSDGENFSFIPIVGMGGLGKTTLARLVFDHFEKEAKKPDKHFDIRTWVCVTKNFELKFFLGEVVWSSLYEQDRSHFDVASQSISTLQKVIKDVLSGKKFLLVLDDLWATDNHREMDSLKAVLRLGSKGSRVLVTSRDQEVSNIEGSTSPYRLQCLGDDYSWSMFVELAFKANRITPELPKELEVLGKRIVRKCKGLPLAIKQMAGLLRGVTDVAQWEAIESSKTWQVDDEDNYNVLSALRLSYTKLPSSVHKQCFIYCSMFPKAHVYEVDELVKLWMAEGVIEVKSTGPRTEEIGRSYFKKLADRFFFECISTDDTKYRMHDAIHDLAMLISDPFYRQVVETEDIQSLDEQSRHVSLLSVEVEQPTSMIISKSKKLRTLLFPVGRFKNFGRPHCEFFLPLVYIRVLDLSSSTLKTLAKTIGELKLLHYLDISKTELKELPDSICDLYHLQTLKLFGCPWIFSLPMNFKKLVNLRHLELDEMFWYKASKLPPNMGCLTNLHNLHKFQVGNENGYKLDELKNMKYLTGSLHISKLENAVNARKRKTNAGEGNMPQVTAEANLIAKKMIDKMVYEWSDSRSNLQIEAIENKLLEDLEPQPRIKELRIFHYRGSEIPRWMGGGKLRDLITLVLRNCERIKIISLGELPYLTEVHLESTLELEEWKEAGYESLDVGKIDEGTYQPLRILTVSNCPKLTRLPCCFYKLEVLKIIKCDKLENIPYGRMQHITLEDNAVMKHWGEESLQVFLKDYFEKVISEGHNQPLPMEIVHEGHNESIPTEMEGVISESNEAHLPTEMEVIIEEGHNESMPIEMEGVISEGYNETLPTEMEIIPQEHNALFPTRIKVISEEEVIAKGHNEPIPTWLEEVISDRHHEAIPREQQEAIMEGHSKQFPRKLAILIFSASMINMKVVNCPALSSLPGGLQPQKLEISKCSAISALPDESCTRGLILLALDSCQGDTLLGMIPSSPNLLSLLISNISDIRCLPTFPLLPNLYTLHMHDCPDLEYLSTPENRLFELLTCLSILSIKNCPKLMTLPTEGLPTCLQYLSVGKCESLNSFGHPDVLVKLQSLGDLYIEDCPALQSLPNDGLPACLLHLCIKGCPSLMEKCREGGSDWLKIKDIPDLEIETPSSPSSTAWFRLPWNY